MTMDPADKRTHPAVAAADELGRLSERGNIYFLTDDEREGVLWAIGLGLTHDDGFPFPRDQNRAILRSARDRLTFPYRAEDGPGA